MLKKKGKQQVIAITYKDVCKDEDCIWFEVGMRLRDRVVFFKWAKALGCVWLSGTEIHPFTGTGGPYISMHSDGKLAYVGMWAWMAYWCKKEESRPKVVGLKDFKAFQETLRCLGR